MATAASKSSTNKNAPSKSKPALEVVETSSKRQRKSVYLSDADLVVLLDKLDAKDDAELHAKLSAAQARRVK